jgi:hypothetical protein
MANVFSDFATLQASAVNDISTAPNLKAYGGELKVIQVSKTSYTAATADPLYICRLPKGARIIPQLCSVDYGDPGDALTGKLGTFTVASTPVAIDDDVFGSGLALGSAAGRKAFTDAGTVGAGILTPASLDQDAWLVATWTTATNAVSHTQVWTIAYTLA